LTGRGVEAQQLEVGWERHEREKERERGREGARKRGGERERERESHRAQKQTPSSRRVSPQAPSCGDLGSRSCMGAG
jgi:hypothetical protein